MKKSSLVIVYHRQPFEEVVSEGKTTFRENKSPNGIVPTLRSFFGRIEPGRGAWIAWKQSPAKAPVNFERLIRIEDDHGGYVVARLPLTAEQVKSFYHVTSKEALWPVLHSFPSLYQYDNVNWATFQEVNRLFAEAAAEQAEDDALVWIHDYNLWLVPHYLRQLKPRARIAFFHHTPFPSPDVFNILPWREEILDSLLQCDLVGFHIPRYARNFADVARVLRGVHVAASAAVEEGMSTIGLALSEPEAPTQLQNGSHTVGLDAFPVGTNPAYIRQLLSSRENRELQESIIQELQGQRLIIAVGRTDYTKGMRESLLAFDRLLARRPEMRGKVKMIVTSVKAASTMEIYKKTQRDVEALVGRINGHYSTLSWTPVLLFTQAFPFERLLAYYRMADVCLTTPLRDGLNLVAKEFIAAKYGDPETPGVLMLSEFAGCAVEFPQAVLTNPHSTRNMDIALDRSLDMPRPDAERRMRAMYDSVCRYDVSCWADHTFARFEAIDQFRTDAAALPA
ncbi:MAG TPA: glucosylglycerol-phosphate synthase [Bryobacteraceae bacterium]|nr:glucosylglycerol-phosphate synthase [Bryobacteraceae bacterium]